MLKGIQLVGQLQEDSGTEDRGRDCALTENGEGAAGRRVEADMLLWALGSHGGLRAPRFSARRERFSSCPEASGWWPGTAHRGPPHLMPQPSVSK